MPLGSYITQLAKFIVSSSIVLGLLVGIAILIAGETTISANLTLEFSHVDSLWWILGLPIFLTLLFVVLSPLSFLVYRLLPVRQSEKTR